MNHENWNIRATQVFAKICEPCIDAVEAAFWGSGKRDVPTCLEIMRADELPSEYVHVVEVCAKLRQKRRPVSRNRILNSIEDTTINTLRIVVRFEQKRRNRRNEYGIPHIPRSVLADIASNFTSSHRVTDQGKLAQFQLCHELIQ